MAQLSGKVQYRTFLEGLVTNATDINNSVNSFIDGLNFEITKKGQLVKRSGLGIVTEKAYVDAGDTLERMVGSSVYTESFSTSDGKKWVILRSDFDFILFEEGTFDAEVWSSSSQYTSKISISTSDEYVIVTSATKRPTYYKYNNGVFESRGEIEIRIRDFDELTPQVDTELRPTVTYLNSIEAHGPYIYDMYNAGWGKSL
jgi:hypothetical protein